MDQKIKSILEDLFQIDPNFKKHEKEIRLLIVDLLKSKPDTQFDTKFAKKLREDLMRVHANAAAQATPSPYFSQFSFYNLRYSLIGSLATLLLVLPFAYYGMNPVKGTKNVSTGFTLEQQINSKGSNAFGSLGMSNNSTIGNSSGGAPAVDAPASSLDNATMQAPTVTEGNMVSGMGSDAARSSKMMIYPAQYIQYEYKGEAFTASSTEGVVYKRIKNVNSSDQLAGILGNANFGLINLNSFSNLKARNIELVEDKDEGYAVNVNFDEGMIAINPNWQKWRTHNTEPMPLSKRPTDESLIATANAFLNERGINRSIYGNPIVQDMQHVMYAQTGAPGTQYAPEFVTVVYPLVINGIEVYEDGGMPHGLNVSVSVRDNKVSGVYNISSQTYESATYTLETDTKRIIDQATYSFVPDMSPLAQKPEVKTVELQTPKKILLRHWVYSSNGENSELYVPALLFPAKAEKVPFSPQSVTVPLVKTILDERSNMNQVPPRPLTEPATLR